MLIALGGAHAEEPTSLEAAMALAAKNTRITANATPVRCRRTNFRPGVCNGTNFASVWL